MSHVAPKNVLTSMVKHVDVAVYLAVKDVLDGRFSGGDVVLGLKEGGVGLAPVADLVPAAQRQAALAEVEKLRARIVSGALTVPATLDELAKAAATRP
jgi:basic membrane protein A